jgi:hypothetical protein
MVMKRSSHRRAIRWILQELTRRINQHKETVIDQTCSAEGIMWELREQRVGRFRKLHAMDVRGRQVALRGLADEKTLPVAGQG